ncbi:MAG TPA: ABC transporter substrate-binding protein [Stellaceae bacterium]|nr:ABC transporter substrate-binding protein [Stellaceae bacterium]
MVSNISRRIALGGLAGSFALAAAPALAADKLRVGKSVAENFGNVPVDVGMEAGIFEKLGLAIEVLNFTGGSKVTQALTAGAVDIALSGGPEMAFIAKGAPEIAIGTISESPIFMGLVVGNPTTVRTVDDLKGKPVGIASPASVTNWAVDELSRQKGWTDAHDRAVPVVIGGSTAAVIAALKTGQVVASMSATQAGYLLEAQNEGRLLIDCSQYVGTFELFTIFASTAITKQNPDAVRRFLKGWYAAVDYMKSHKDETVRIASRVTNYPPDVMARSYDAFMPAFSTNGRWDPKALEALRTSFVQLKLLNEPIDMSKFYTEQFLPAA